MTFWEFAGRAADVSSVPGLLVGFAITIYQVKRTRRTAEAAAAAAKAAQAAISRSNVLALIPQLERIEEDIAEAIRNTDNDNVSFSLLAWRRKASQVRGLLEVAGLTERRHLVAIQDSITLAMEARTELLGSGSSDMFDPAKAALRAISRVTDELGAMASAQGIKSGGAGHAG